MLQSKLLGQSLFEERKRDVTLRSKCRRTKMKAGVRSQQRLNLLIRNQPYELRTPSKLNFRQAILWPIFPDAREATARDSRIRQELVNHPLMKLSLKYNFRDEI